MTREEAIQELQNCKGLIQQDGQDYLDERDIPLLDMAIEALSLANLKPEFESAEAVQGEWIHDGQNFKGGLDWSHCSECGYKTSTKGLRVYRYCPNCGARMKGGAE